MNVQDVHSSGTGTQLDRMKKKKGHRARCVRKPSLRGDKRYSHTKRHVKERSWTFWQLPTVCYKLFLFLISKGTNQCTTLQETKMKRTGKTHLHTYTYLYIPKVWECSSFSLRLLLLLLLLHVYMYPLWPFLYTTGRRLEVSRNVPKMKLFVYIIYI